MESNRINPSPQTALSKNRASSAQKTAAAPQSLTFTQALAQAAAPAKSKVTQPEFATLAPLVKPRSHLQLISLNPVETTYEPAPAALEKMGKSRLVDFAVGTGQ